MRINHAANASAREKRFQDPVFLSSNEMSMSANMQGSMA